MIMKQLILSFLLIIMPLQKIFAYDIMVPNNDGVNIYYNWTDNNSSLAVTSANSWTKYSGSINIPEFVEYEGNTFKVTSIGSFAFSGCYDLTSVTIPNSVISLELGAFESCGGLTTITIPNSVTKIDNSAFQGCSGLTSLIIPNSVYSIGSNTFYNCINLSSITIPISVYSIGSGAFNETAWYNNQPDGLVYAGKVAYNYKGQMPDNTKIVLKDGTKSISQDAFHDCIGLKFISIPSSVISIGSNAFNGCTGLRDLTLPNSVISIGDYAFYGCNGLKTIHSEIENLFEISTYVFYSSYYPIPSSEVTLIVPSGKKTIYQTTAGWKEFKNIVEAGEGGVVGKSYEVDNINYYINKNYSVSAGSNGNSYRNINIPNQVTINGKDYSVTSIGDYAFQNCKDILSVVIPNSVTTIGSYAFDECRNLSSIIIGTGVTSILSSAFNGTNIFKVIWLTNTPPTGYGNIRGSINYVSNDQFGMLSNVVKYPFLSSMFEVDGIRYAPVSLSERTCDAIDCVYNESSAITKIPSKVTYKGIEMNVQKVQPYICYNNIFVNHLSMEIGGTVSQYAFNGCKNMLTAILGSVEEGFNTDSFSGLYIGSNISTIDNFVFGGCEKLNKLIIADRESELSLGTNGSSSKPLFYSCPLESVYIGGNITYDKTANAGYSPFYRNTAIKSITITDKETEISENEFYGCTNLQRVSIGDGVTSIGDWAFSGCQSLSYFAFGTQLQTIGQESFSDCTNVIEIISKTSTPPVCGSQALDDINKWDCKLYVPDGSLTGYQAADQWKEFLFAEEGTGTAEQNPSGEGPKKCGTPKINFTGDKLSFTSDTEEVNFVYRVSCSDEKYGSGSEVELKKTYTITVYATKEGYADSDVAKTTIEAGGSGVFGDLTGDGVVNVADHVKLSDIIMHQNK